MSLRDYYAAHAPVSRRALDKPAALAEDKRKARYLSWFVGGTLSTENRRKSGADKSEPGPAAGTPDEFSDAVEAENSRSAKIIQELRECMPGYDACTQGQKMRTDAANKIESIEHDLTAARTRIVELENALRRLLDCDLENVPKYQRAEKSAREALAGGPKP